MALNLISIWMSRKASNITSGNTYFYKHNKRTNYEETIYIWNGRSITGRLFVGR